ncbi:hypothetical protein AAF712_014785 [Marasmius tenuissimus]|uniref:F-box domain-containing protein n=1 Tax=Marasmius tenuissimus TaxID=585030 RepID=A0ABR2ZAC4_9AGAR
MSSARATVLQAPVLPVLRYSEPHSACPPGIDRSDSIPTELWIIIFSLLSKTDLFACARLKKRLSLTARHVLYRALEFSDFASAWSNIRFWRSGDATPFRRVPRSISIGSDGGKDPLVAILMDTVASLRSITDITIVNQNVHPLKLFAMTQGRRLSSLTLRSVIFGPPNGSYAEDFAFKGKNALSTASRLLSYLTFVPPTPSHVSLVGVYWYPRLDPMHLLPRTVGSRYVTSLELDVHSFLMIEDAFSSTSSTFGNNVQSFRLLSTKSRFGSELDQGKMEILRRRLLTLSSSLSMLVIQATCIDVFQGCAINLPNLREFNGPEEILPLLGECAQVEKLVVRLNDRKTEFPVTLRFSWANVRALSILRWSGDVGAISSILRSVHGTESFELECMSSITTVCACATQEYVAKPFSGVLDALGTSAGYCGGT